MAITSKQRKEIKKILKGISNKRARIVIEHILSEGSITTEDLETKYGYKHPPRAARDVRECGIPLETFPAKNSAGRTIAAYRFGDLTQVRADRLQGRQTFTRQFKALLYSKQNGQCGICSGRFEERYLQVDHRVPYEIAGDPQVELKLENFMLLCGSCNRAKSWSCEHCENWLNEKSPNVCSTCYWASPESYAHIALRKVRRADIIWDKDELEIYERLKEHAEQSKSPIPDFVKKIVEKFVRK